MCFAEAYHMNMISVIDLCLVYMFQVHLSDDHGMGILARVLWRSAFDQLYPPTPTVQVPPRPPTPVRAFSPKLVVKGEVVLPRTSNPCEWTVVSRNRKVCLEKFFKNQEKVLHVRNIYLIMLSFMSLAYIKLFFVMTEKPLWGL